MVGDDGLHTINMRTYVGVILLCGYYVLDECVERAGHQVTVLVHQRLQQQHVMTSPGCECVERAGHQVTVLVHRRLQQHSVGTSVRRRSANSCSQSAS